MYIHGYSQTDRQTLAGGNTYISNVQTDGWSMNNFLFINRMLLLDHQLNTFSRKCKIYIFKIIPKAVIKSSFNEFHTKLIL